MELRFLEGNFDHGKFKLQFKNELSDLQVGSPGKKCEVWLDVPCVQEETKPEWCKHLSYSSLLNSWTFESSKKNQSLNADFHCFIFCPICGAKKPV